MTMKYCEEIGCTRSVLEPHIYCDKHVDKSSTPYIGMISELSSLYKEYTELCNILSDTYEIYKPTFEGFMAWLAERTKK